MLLEIVPSIASANQSCLRSEVKRLGENINNIHIDIEDGNFIPNITFGLRMVKDLREITDKPFSLHLMVNNPENYIFELSEIGVDSITVHLEACKYPRRIINMVKDLNIKIGMALNPKTSTKELEYIINDLDLILIMTSEPDNRKQLFIPDMLKKIAFLSELKREEQEIWVDGGVEEKHLNGIWKSGADKVVMGRAVFNYDNPSYKLSELKNLIYSFE